MTSRYITKNDRPNLLNQMVLLERKIATGSETDILFSDISQKYNDLIVKVYANSNAASASALNGRVNGLSTTIYNYQRTYHTVSTLTTSQTNNSSQFRIGAVSAGSGFSDEMNMWDMHIFEYSNSEKYKSVESVGYYSTTTAPDIVSERTTSLIEESNAITSLTIRLDGVKTFSEGSVFEIYGRGLKVGATVQELDESTTVICNAYLSADQNAADATQDDIELDATTIDTHNIFDAAGYKMVIPRDGYYNVSAACEIDNPTSTSQHANLTVYKGVINVMRVAYRFDSTSNNGMAIPSRTLYLEEGDELTLSGRFDHSGSGVFRGEGAGFLTWMNLVEVK